MTIGAIRFRQETIFRTCIIARADSRVATGRRLTQVQAAKLLGVDQPKVSSILNGRLDGFSTDRLMQFLNDLGCDVKISASEPHAKARNDQSHAGDGKLTLIPYDLNYQFGSATIARLPRNVVYWSWDGVDA